MVYLALTPKGLKEALAKSAADGSPVWCSADALSEQEFKQRQTPGLTRFNESLSASDPEALAEAIATIEEHHPGSRILVEGSTPQ